MPRIVPLAVSLPSRVQPDPSRGGGEPEIQDLRAVGSEEEIGRFEVSMNESSPVQLLKGREHLRAEVQGVGDRQRPPRQAIGQGLPLKQFHGEPGVAVQLAHIEYGADARVIHGGRGSRFPLESPATLLVGAR